MRWRLGAGPGNAVWHWSVAGRELEVHSTYLGDGLKSLLESARDLRIGSRSSFAHFQDEPMGTRIFFSAAEETVYVQIVWFQDLQSTDNRWAGARPIWDGRVSTMGFVNEVHRMTEQLLAEVGEEGYRKRWVDPFPSRELEALRKALAGPDRVARRP
jgi:hypothetical protein